MWNSASASNVSPHHTPRAATGVAMTVLLCLSATHLLNDLLQSVVTACYPLLKADLHLSFAEIGLVTLVYQTSASVFQPVVGLVFDRRPSRWSLTIATTLTMLGIIGLTFSQNVYMLAAGVFVIGMGSSIVHPEASRIASLASGGRRGLAQSTFQVGGNFGSAMGPLLVALIVAPAGRHHILWFLLFSLAAYAVERPIARWFRRYLAYMREEHLAMRVSQERPLSLPLTVLSIGVLLVLIFSKYVYMASLSSYYTFYLIERFGVSVQFSQICLFVFLAATAVGTMIGGPLGDRIGRKYVIWLSILGAAPFSLAMPHVGLAATVALSFCIGLVISSAFPAILLYAQELLPYNLGLVSGLFFGFAFGIAGVASAVLGGYADRWGLEAVYDICAYMPLVGLVACLLPNISRKRR